MIKFWQKWMKPSIECTWCYGKGKVPVFIVKDRMTKNVECPRCNGTGREKK